MLSDGLRRLYELRVVSGLFDPMLVPVVPKAMRYVTSEDLRTFALWVVQTFKTSATYDAVRWEGDEAQAALATEVELRDAHVEEWVDAVCELGGGDEIIEAVRERLATADAKVRGLAEDSPAWGVAYAQMQAAGDFTLDYVASPVE